MKKPLFTHSLAIVLYCCLLFPSKTSAQIYGVKNYSVEDGLTTNSFNDITQGKMGRMWFASDNGISLYDGFNWFHFDKSTRYAKLFCGKDGTIWAAPISIYNDIFCFKIDEAVEKIPPPEIDKKEKIFISSLIVDDDGDKPVIYLGTNNGLYLYKNGVWEHYTSQNGLMHNQVNTMSFYEGKLYLCTHGGLSIFSNGYFDNSLGESLMSQDKRPNALYFEKTGSSPMKMWVIGNNYLGYIIDNQLTIVEKDLSRLTHYDYNSNRYFINKGNDEDLLFVGNRNNGYIYRKSTREFFPLLQENGFQGDGCSALFADREGNLWRTWKRGIDKLNNINVFSYNTSNGLLENEVTAIFEYAPGKLLLGHNNGITFFSKDSIKRIKIDNTGNTVRGNLRVMKFCRDKNGTIWFASSNHGVGKLDLSGHITWFHNLFNMNICSINVDDDGLLWVTSDRGVFTVKNGDFHNPTNMGLITTFYREVFIIDNVPYFTSPLGIITLKDGKPLNISINNNINANDIYCVHKAPSGEIIVGGKDGLYRIKNNSLEKYDKLVIDKYVYSMIIDKHNNYWFGTDNGVIINPTAII